MIVREAGASWQVVLQTDHAELAGAIAAAWADKGPRHASLVLAARRHDDGWAVWERSPLVDPESGRPVNFLDVRVPVHLAFYRAAIAAISEEDAYAGLLVSMHAAGIYRRRYGTDPSLGLADASRVPEEVEAFVAEQEAGYARRMAEAGVDDERRWADYHLLQLYDRLSLYFCMRDLEAGEEAELPGLRLTPLAPWRVRVEPYPFQESPARFTLLRRLLPKRRWSSAELRQELSVRPAQAVEVAFQA
jgi:hypothetical protein